jgi:hypothetical protein
VKWSEAEKYLANGERQFGQSQQSAIGAPIKLSRPVMSGMIGMARVAAASLAMRDIGEAVSLAKSKL